MTRPPALAESDVTVYLGDARDVLAELPDRTVDCIITSPPYFGLRDYGTADWNGGDPACDHLVSRDPGGTASSGLADPRNGLNADTIARKVDQVRPQYRDRCGKCGAQRVDRQIGLEATMAEYVAELVGLFREARRVLADHGTLWLNLGDSYVTRPGGADAVPRRNAGTRPRPERDGRDVLPEKNLAGVPWRVALALQADGWILRSDIIWAKPNAMPESVTDRPTCAHEYVFMLAKSPRYHFDQEAVREPHKPDGRHVSTRTVGDGSHDNYQSFGHEEGRERWPNGGRNVRTVWEIPARPYGDKHFATYPEELVTRALLAGCPRDVCATCGRPRPAGGECACAYGLEPGDLDLVATPTGAGEAPDPSLEVGRAGLARPRNDGQGVRTITRYEQRQYASQLRASPYRAAMLEQAGGDTAFAHYVRTDRAGARPIPGDLLEHWLAVGWLTPVTLPEPRAGTYRPGTYRPGVVLDPFLGSGTTAVVARRERRHAVGIELNPDYLPLIERRLANWHRRPVAAPDVPDDQLTLIE